MPVALQCSPYWKSVHHAGVFFETCLDDHFSHMLGDAQCDFHQGICIASWSTAFSTDLDVAAHFKVILKTSFDPIPSISALRRLWVSTGIVILGWSSRSWAIILLQCRSGPCCHCEWLNVSVWGPRCWCPLLAVMACGCPRIAYASMERRHADWRSPNGEVGDVPAEG